VRAILQAQLEPIRGAVESRGPQHGRRLLDEASGRRRPERVDARRRRQERSARGGSHGRQGERDRPQLGFAFVIGRAGTRRFFRFLFFGRRLPNVPRQILPRRLR
jgi:hypothetical protein